MDLEGNSNSGTSAAFLEPVAPGTLGRCCPSPSVAAGREYLQGSFAWGLAVNRRGGTDPDQLPNGLSCAGNWKLPFGRGGPTWAWKARQRRLGIFSWTRWPATGAKTAPHDRSGPRAELPARSPTCPVRHPTCGWRWFTRPNPSQVPVAPWTTGYMATALDI